MSAALMPGAANSAAREIHLRIHGLHSGDRCCVIASEEIFLVRPNKPSQLHYAAVNGHFDVPRINIGIGEERGLYLCRDAGIGAALSLTPARLHRARNEGTFGEENHYCRKHRVPTRPALPHGQPPWSGM